MNYDYIIGIVDLSHYINSGISNYFKLAIRDGMAASIRMGIRSVYCFGYSCI